MNRNRSLIIEGFFFLILIVLTVGFYRTISPFVMDIFFAMLFVALAWPIRERFAKRTKGNISGAAALSVVSLFFMVAIPLSGLAVVFSVKTVGGIVASVNAWVKTLSALSAADFFGWLSTVPVIGRYTDVIRGSELTSLINEVIDFSSKFVLSITRKSIISLSGMVFHLFILLFLMYFLFKEGDRLSRRIRDLLPLPDRDTDRLLREMKMTSSATLISTFLIGIMEGTMGGLVFLFFGLPSPLVFGMLIMVISIVPLVGANLIMVPTGIIMMLSGRVIGGIAVIVISYGYVAVTQNIIKPKLLGNRSGLHPALALLSILGGIAWLGIVGFIVGPLVAAMFIVIWEQFGLRYSVALSGKNVDHDTAESGNVPDESR